LPLIEAKLVDAAFLEGELVGKVVEILRADGVDEVI